MIPSEIRSLLAELSALPYENLSKIVARHQGKTLESALNFSASWLHDHLSLGMGGTCFALTHWLKIKMDALGMSTAYLMADKRREKNIHCGLLWEWRGRNFLLDPGYLIFEPMELPRAGLAAVVFISPNEVRLEDVPGEGVWRLHSGLRGVPKHRFDFRREPVNAGEFQRHWESSYAWPMMQYPVLNRVLNGTQYYLQKNNLMIRTATASEMRKLQTGEMLVVAQTMFGLPRGLVEEAMGILSNSKV